MCSVTDVGKAQLLVAHPGHELLLHAWICRTKPVVHVLTDGSGHSNAPRLDASAKLLREAGARPGVIFGRLSDRQAYAMILERNMTLLLSLVMELAEELRREQPIMIVIDAAEAYNPVHDLSRLIAGAAIEMANVDTKQYEYAVVNSPYSFDSAHDDVIAFDLDDAAHAAKIEQARLLASLIPDADDLLSRFGTEAYRREALRRVLDWAHIDTDSPALYEQFGEQRLAAHRYQHVIRRAEHMIPLRDALLDEVRKHACVF
ncbi:MAG: hypothetical protein DMF57_08125 [Acidobacteria bacterium]|nr:MAG: hypothetical protein DMF57_08125 [Acidobacteriota bacterium]